MTKPVRNGNATPHPRSYAEPALVFALVAVAAFFRLYRLTTIPPGLNLDEAHNLLDILRLLQGQFSPFFPANNGREPLFFYLAAVNVAILGPGPLALRLTSALIGVATVPLVYGFARSLFGSVRVAALAGLFTSISVWHLFYSRFGLRVILAVPLSLLAVWAFWKGLTTFRRGAFLIAGIVVALDLYCYLGSRVIPVIFIFLAVAAALSCRARAGACFKGLLVTGAVAGLLCVPLGLYFIQHPDDFARHAEDLSIWNPSVSNGPVLAAFWENTRLVTGMFLAQGDDDAYRNIPGRPVFDPFLGLFFVVGVGLLLFSFVCRKATARDRLRAWMLAVCLAAFLLLSILSDDAPNFLRTLPAVPIVMVLAAWGMSEMWGRLPGRTVRRFGTIACGALIVTSAWIGYRDYFIDFGPSGVAYYAFEAHLGDVATWINARAQSSRLFLAPLWSLRGTMAYLTRGSRLGSFESRDTVVLPDRAAGQDALYLFPPEQEQKVRTLAERLGTLGTREDLTGKFGERLMLVLRVLAPNLPDERDPLGVLAQTGAWSQPQARARAVWNDQIELLGYTASPEGPGGRNLAVTLVLRSLQLMTQDYHFSVKVRDEQERVWGQDDKATGDNSFATTQWAAGDLVIEKFYPGLSACAPAGDYYLTVEAYDPVTLRAVGLTDQSGAAVSLGRARAGASESNRLEHLEPEVTLNATLAPQLHLIGLTLTPQSVHGGDPFSLALFWQGAGDGTSSASLDIRLRDAAQQEYPLAQRAIALPAQDRGVCTFFDLTAPADLLSGPYSLLLNNAVIAALELDD